MSSPNQVELRTAPGPATPCKRCREPIAWAKTQRGASIPIDSHAEIEVGAASFFVSSDHVHFATCKAQQGKARKPDKRTDYEKKLERRVDLLRQELAESAPRDAATWANDRTREIEKRLRQAVTDLRAIVEQTPADQIVSAQQIANNLDEWMLEFSTRGVRPYEHAGRRVGD